MTKKVEQGKEETPQSIGTNMNRITVSQDVIERKKGKGQRWKEKRREHQKVEKSRKQKRQIH